MQGERGFTLVEVLICTLILTTGMLAIAGLLGVSTQMQIGAREAARSMRLAQEKVDQLMKMDFDTADEVAVGGSLTENSENHFEEPLGGITVRWAVADGPVEDTRVITIRVVNLRAQQYRETDMTTKLARPFKRELEVNGEKYTLTLDPDGLKLVAKGRRKGIELKWESILGGDAALASALNAQLEASSHRQAHTRH